MSHSFIARFTQCLKITSSRLTDDGDTHLRRSSLKSANFEGLSPLKRSEAIGCLSALLISVDLRDGASLVAGYLISVPNKNVS